MHNMCMVFNPGIHHRRSIRLKNYDYSQEGYYFITICTKYSKDYFGEIKNGKMHLNEIGNIIYDEWIKTGQIRTNVHLDLFVIMPNHFHELIIINDQLSVGTCRGMPLQQRQQFGKPISNSLPIIINQFKSSVKRICNKNGFKYFEWQRNYYEHIIRNENDLARIRDYILNNPIKWELKERSHTNYL